MNIREARRQDLQAMTEIYNQAIKHTVATFDIEPKKSEEREAWFYQHNEKYPLFVAEDERVIGWIALSKLFDKEAYAGTFEISIYVDEGHRKKGVGHQLMQKLMAYVKATGCCHTIIARIAGGNEVSQRLHEQYGFIYTGTLKEVGYKFNQYVDVHFYQWLKD